MATPWWYMIALFLIQAIAPGPRKGEAGRYRPMEIAGERYAQRFVISLPRIFSMEGSYKDPPNDI